MESGKKTGEQEYLIGELAALADVTVRTIRYYTDEGLLPQAETRGKYAYYNRRHLLRLELIQKMKEAYLPLREIRQAIEGMSDEEVERQLRSVSTESMQPPKNLQVSEAKSSALDYIARVRSRQDDLRSTDKSSEITLPARPQANQPPKMGKIVILDDGLPGETWRRIEIAPGIELHLREPVESDVQADLESMIKDIQVAVTKRRGGVK
jgi:DNA-binding transcriptional MerR regulator